MSLPTLTVHLRSVSGRRVKKLRAQGLIPANVFGKDVASVSLQVDSKTFSKVASQVGESTLFYLQVAGEKQPRPVFIHEITPHPVSGHLLHVSFHQVNLKEKVTAPVKVVLVGEAPAQKDGIGVLVQHLHEVDIEALPADMPDRLEADISGLAAVDSAVYVKDLKIGPKLTVQIDPETIVAKIESLAKEEVVAKPVVSPEVPAEGEKPPAEPQLEENKKEEK